MPNPLPQVSRVNPESAAQALRETVSYHQLYATYIHIQHNKGTFPCGCDAIDLISYLEMNYPREMRDLIANK